MKVSVRQADKMHLGVHRKQTHPRRIRSAWRWTFTLLLFMPAVEDGALASSSGRAKIAVHVVPLNFKNPCTPSGLESCTDVVSQGALADPEGSKYRVYFLSEADSTGHSLSAVVFIDYDQGDPSGSSNHRGIDIDAGGCCGPCFFNGVIPRPVPEPMSYVIAGSCDSPPFQLLFYYDITVYSPDTLRVIPGTESYQTILHDCVTGENQTPPVDDLGFAVFSLGAGSGGCNPCLVPCGATPVRQATWTGIKLLFR